MEAEKISEKPAAQGVVYVYCDTNNCKFLVQVCVARAFNPKSNCPSGCSKLPEGAYEFRSALPKKKGRACKQ